MCCPLCVYLKAVVNNIMAGPDYSFEMAAMARGASCVAGVDEVGRGPLAGPVTAAAVILDGNAIPDGLNDSKALSAKAREALNDRIMACAEVSIAHASVAASRHRWWLR